jgi:hypothetical protein
MPANPKFDFYERVRVRTSNPTTSHLNGEIGTVIGRTETEDHPDPFYYAVDIDSSTVGWCFFESELESTGEWANPEDYFDGSWVRVRVDQRGRGTVVPPDDQE